MFQSRATAAVRLGGLKRCPAGGPGRVAAEVDGFGVWFESADLRLSPAPEALASAFLVPALHRAATLVCEQPLDAEWRANVARLMDVLHAWWGYAPRPPESPAVPPDPVEAAGPGVALFFSGGADSFYSLLRGGRAPDRLVAVQGFDIALDDAARWAAAEGTLRAVGRALGIRTAVVRTNLREHPLVRAAPWERANGGALAGVGHVLGEDVGEVRVSSSVDRTEDLAWGSHWRIDPLHSSSRLRVRQVGTEHHRLVKLRLIADEPLVRRHLRVCWENRVPTGNCSRCSKCLITRLALADHGTLDAFETLEGTASLAADLDALRSYHNLIPALAAFAASPRLHPDVRRAVGDLVARTRHVRSWPVRARRALLGRIAGPGAAGRP